MEVSRSLIAEVSAVEVRPLSRPARSGAKRLLDVLVASTGLVVLIPVFALIALTVIVDSGWPAFFRQTRLGLRGREFRVWKFRTMVQQAEDLRDSLTDLNEASFPAFKMRRDPRVTRVGRFLRRSSLDELPQLLNVLRGDMSLVGPRPPLPREVAHYDGRALCRLETRPGITGHWQVQHRHQGEISFEQWLDSDLGYIEHWSFVGDLRLIVRTAGAVLMMNGQ